jgi:hypothetical protein
VPAHLKMRLCGVSDRNGMVDQAQCAWEAGYW